MSILISPLGGTRVDQTRKNFKISLQGPFDVKWADYIGDKLVHAETEEGTPQITTLYGFSVDLSEFLGTLHTFIDLGYPVIAFEYCDVSSGHCYDDGNT
jgi:hypothetical protein